MGEGDLEEMGTSLALVNLLPSICISAFLRGPSLQGFKMVPRQEVLPMGFCLGLGGVE